MPKIMTRANFATLMADTAMKMPLSQKRSKKKPAVDEFDYDLKSNEWADAVQYLNGVGPTGMKQVSTPEGGYKRVPMTKLGDMPAFIKGTVKEAMLELGVVKVTM